MRTRSLVGAVQPDRVGRTPVSWHASARLLRAKRTGEYHRASLDTYELTASSVRPSEYGLGSGD